MLHAELTERIIEACFQVHNELGPGFLEGVYERALAIALQEAGLQVESQVGLTVWYRGQPVGEYVTDLLVNSIVILELKAVRAMAPEFQAQAINYLKGTHLDVGLVVNFGSPRVEVKRVYRPLPRSEARDRPFVEDVALPRDIGDGTG